MIKLVDFSKTYYTGLGRKPYSAVHHITFEAGSGKITGLLGLNGAGKTTIIRAICALHYATEGKVLVGPDESHLINPTENPELVKTMIGYVPEHADLYKNFTVREFLETVASIRGLDRNIRKDAIDRVVTEFSLEPVYNKKNEFLSKGYCQRVSFAQAFLHDPPILVLDEPGSGLDPAQLHQIRNFLKKVATHKTVLLSTHLMQEAETLCTDVCIISRGLLSASGAMTTIIKQQGCYSLEDAFLKITDAEKNNK